VSRPTNGNSAQVNELAPIRTGLVGAGHWAQTMHAPLHAAPGVTELTGVWSPSPDRARALADRHGVPAFASFDALLAASEAVDFAVPPAVQAELAIEAAKAGKALLLEKPLGSSLDEAERVAAAVERTGVPNIVVLTKRFHRRTREFLASALELGPAIAVTGRYVHGGFLDDSFLGSRERTGWRRELGVLYDLGPHLLDLVDAAAGSIVSVTASGRESEAVLLSTEHEGGASGQLLLSGRVRTPDVLTDVDLYANEGHLHYTTLGMDHEAIWPEIRAEFASAVRQGTPVTVDVTRAVAVQRAVEAAARSFTARRPVDLADL
jgi:predicted dehydrogenase